MMSEQDNDNRYQADVSQKIFAGAKKVRRTNTPADVKLHLVGGFGQKWHPERNSLLDHADEYKSANILLSVVPPRDKIILRGEKSALAAAVKKIVGLAMPQPLHYSAGKNYRLSWVSPDEWLLYLPLGAAAEIIEKLGKELKGKHHGLVDVSDYYLDILLKGSARFLLLNKGSPFDTDERVFTAGQVVSTHYANASIVLTQFDDECEIQVRSSFAPYLWDYLIVGAKEFG
ncbi:MAG: sarcosine oxidase subunit gamma family protein [Hydrotalea sp.]|nr:sarcosine oxidase subunit gamma family protein [Hydrotalea sp.]